MASITWISLPKREAGQIEELCRAGLQVGEPDTGHASCLLSLEAQYTINRDKLN